MNDKNINYNGSDERIDTRGGVSCVTYSVLDALGFVKHGFALRTGGVSKGYWESMNLSYARGDVKENVDENYRRIAAFFNTSPDRMIAPCQTHTSIVLKVGAEDAGKSITREKLQPDADALITNVPGIMLTTSHADCTPIFLVDPINRAIGMVHSGWRGTVGTIAANAIAAMHKEYGTDPADIVAAIGPCICGDCYEIGSEVAIQFISRYGSLTSFSEVNGTGAMLRPLDNGKYLLNQKAVNVRILMNAGVNRKNIAVSHLCTFERSDLFFSHRKMGEKRGLHRAFLGING